MSLNKQKIPTRQRLFRSSRLCFIFCQHLSIIFVKITGEICVYLFWINRNVEPWQILTNLSSPNLPVSGSLSPCLFMPMSSLPILLIWQIGKLLTNTVQKKSVLFLKTNLNGYVRILHKSRFKYWWKKFWDWHLKFFCRHAITKVQKRNSYWN